MAIELDDMIPQIFHQVWISDIDPKLLLRFVQYSDGCLRLQAEREIKLSKIPNIDVPHHLPKPIKFAPNSSQLSDNIRFEAVDQCGGIHVNIDFECCGSTEALIAGAVTLNPERDCVIKAYSGNHNIQQLAA